MCIRAVVLVSWVGLFSWSPCTHGSSELVLQNLIFDPTSELMFLRSSVQGKSSVLTDANKQSRCRQCRKCYCVRFEKRLLSPLIHLKSLFLPGGVSLSCLEIKLNLKRELNPRICPFPKDEEVSPAVTSFPPCPLCWPAQLPTELAGSNLAACSLHPQVKALAGEHTLTVLSVFLPLIHTYHTTMTSANSCSRSLFSSPRVSTLQPPSDLA